MSFVILEKLKSTNIRYLRVDYSTISDGTKGQQLILKTIGLVEYSTISDGTKGMLEMLRLSTAQFQMVLKDQKAALENTKQVD